MSLLEVTGLFHRFGDQPLYKNAAFAVERGEHMGVVGPNGAGKSTLVRILTGETVPDDGRVRWQKGVRVGHLNQYADIDGAMTVLACLRSAFGALYEKSERLERLYEEYAASGREAALEEAARCQEELELAGFYEVESRIARAATGLGLNALGLDTPLARLSGGQRAKVILAKLLLEQADVLLLDEPTNFLDKEHVAWLSGCLAAFPGAFLVVSHDAQFLESVSGCILDIEFESIRKYHGGYAAYLRQKEQLREDHLRHYAAQQKQISQTEEFIRRNKAGIKSKMARGRQKQLDRLDRLAPPAYAARPIIRFRESAQSAQNPLEAEGLVIGYQKPLLPGLSFTVRPGEKLVVTGFNGVGKSTLLKTLLGLLPPLDGSCGFTETARIGYYEQELCWQDGGRTPLECLAEEYPLLDAGALRRQLAQCGVKQEHFSQPVATLSGGEQAKVKLCRLLLSPVNFLVLDEVTNHLDAQTKEVLREALEAFGGSVLLVSHEEAFYRDWAHRVLRIG